MDTNNFNRPIIELSGVGKTTEKRLSKMGISTFGDLVYLFPRAYENRGNIRPLSKFDSEMKCSFLLTVGSDVKNAKLRQGLTISKFRAFDESGSCEIVFFNAPYVKDVFVVGSEFRFWGKAVMIGKKLQLQNPAYEPYIEGRELPDLIPIYPLTEGISSKNIDKLVRMAMNEVIPEISDPIPEEIRVENHLPTLTYALMNSHFPQNEMALKNSLKRLAFDEMLYFGLGISLRAHEKRKTPGIAFSPCSLKPLLDMLPYELTASQKNAVNDMHKDMVASREGKEIYPMTRILVGDVGCGKTVCALIAAYIASQSGFQTALMVPTEILAEQHYEDAKKLLCPLGLNVALLTGATTQKEKKQIYAALKNGEIQIVIGTHAIISDKVEFDRLGLVITDEQHRFGVMQRAKLKEKMTSAHLLVMSATPIPRSLALAMYGDLDITRITDMPKGRQKIDTFVVNESYRSRLNDFIKKQVLLGGQCYIVCPSIEKSESDVDAMIPESTSNFVYENSIKLKNVIEYTASLKADLPDISIDLLHGKMKPAEKDMVMSKFTSGETKVLVSTTVIEVGVNVPNATLMIVENAERFGLSQLHQLRGRVGRGTMKSYCVLVSDFNSEKSIARLNVMKSVSDGFEIAERDLTLRGPGDFFATNSSDILRQSGGFQFKFASMCDDTDLFSAAFATAKKIINIDPKLDLPIHKGLKEAMIDKLNASTSTIS